jgi:hypothetical protein
MPVFPADPKTSSVADKMCALIDFVASATHPLII